MVTMCGRAILTIAAFASLYRSVDAKAKRPHIIFNLVDDLGWNDVGWHDSFDQIKTPKLNAFVNESIKLSQYYVYRFCSPSRSTFLTGRYPWHIGQQTHMNLNPTPGIACGINTKYDFLPKVLKKAGYATYALGKWHLGYHTNEYTPTYRGFDHFLGYYSGAEEHFTHTKNGESYTAYDLANNTGDNVRPCLTAVGNASATYSSYLYGNETLRLLDRHDPAVPFFAYLAWNNVHAPTEAPKHYQDMHLHIKDSGRRNMAAMMSALDDNIMSIISKLKEKGMWEDTIFIFNSDNGGNLHGSGNNYPLRGGKYTFWQGGCRVPAFVGGGDNFIPRSMRGADWNGKVHAADWYTTIAALAGVSVTGTGPLPADGVDIWASLVSNNTSPRKEVTLQISSDNSANRITYPSEEYCSGSPWDHPHCEPPATPSTSLRIPGTTSNLTLGVLIQDQWKLIYGYPGWNPKWDGWIKAPSLANAWNSEMTADDGSSGSKPTPENFCHAKPCLFDILADPTEHHDVAEAHAEVVARMTSRLLELAGSEVTVAESGLCPTSYGSRPDPRCKAKAKATGFWEPWLKEEVPQSELLV